MDTHLALSNFINQLQPLKSISFRVDSSLCHTPKQDVYDLTDQGIKWILEKHKDSLTQLFIPLSKDTTAQGYVWIIENCKKLTDFHATHCDFTNENVANIFKNCSQITSLSLSNDLDINQGSNSLSEAALTHLAKECPNLQKIQTYCWSRLSEASLQILSTQFSQLTEFVIHDRTNMSDTIIENVVSTCNNLKHVRLSKDSNITDKSLKYLATCTHLESITLASPAITDEGIRYFIDHYRGTPLQTIAIHETAIKQETKDLLKKTYPGIKIFPDDAPPPKFGRRRKH